MIPSRIAKRGCIKSICFTCLFKLFCEIPLVSLYGSVHVLDGLKLAICDLSTEYGTLNLVVLLLRYLN